MNQHLTQPDGGRSAFVGKTDTSALEAVVATVLLAFTLHVFWCCFRSSCGLVKRLFTRSPPPSSATKMDLSVIAAVEKILNYKFRNKSLLEEAMTHASFSRKESYERLEFLGDAALGLAVATHFLSSGHPELTPGQLTKLRKRCVSNKKLASVAAEHRLYWFLRRKNTLLLDQDVMFQ
ncbi:hypothetical protein CCACVL1_11363 [Corchorus capsularis]|uniref:RNase III domain-containing protein n=1 Tax=Corchorus capsularis TaxID=210143 RepID=A0A1R3ILV9_COCAP|nr:hypothetical protein CCACVL1_11363 [Corchorus capsularis]